MHIQPHSLAVRRYIPTSDYLALVNHERTRTFVGDSLIGWADEAIQERIVELSALENQGFMFVGEKNWLESYSKREDKQSLQHYDDWVRDTLKSFLGVNFELVNQPPNEKSVARIWRTTFQVSELRMDYPHLRNRAYEDVTQLQLTIGGDVVQPGAAFMTVLFEVLHDFEYMMSTLNSNWSDDPAMQIEGVEITNHRDPGRCRLNVQSYWGTKFDREILNARGWRGQ